MLKIRISLIDSPIYVCYGLSKRENTFNNKNDIETILPENRIRLSDQGNGTIKKTFSGVRRFTSLA